MASVGQVLLLTYFFFFAVAFFFAGAFFFAFEAPFFAAFFIGMFASSLRSVSCFEPLSSQALPQQPPTSHTPWIIWGSSRPVNSGMPFWKFFFKVGKLPSSNGMQAGKMLLARSPCTA